MLTYKQTKNKNHALSWRTKNWRATYFTTAVVHGSLEESKEREKGNLQAFIGKYRTDIRSMIL